MRTQVTVKDKVFKIGDNTPMGTIKEFFTADDQLCFFTEENNFFPVRYLIEC